MIKITEVPVELILDYIPRLLPLPDFVHLALTSKFFASLLDDELLWKQFLEWDYNFSDERTARVRGWKFLYKGMHRPKIFLWGESANCRLGNIKPDTRINGVSAPRPLKMPAGVTIVSLAAAGWSFFALDSKGSIHVWGTLNDGHWSSASSTPLRLVLPAPIRSISTGRHHATTLDSNGDVWTFTSWVRPFRLVSPLLDRSSDESTPVLVESGWRFSSVLTASGDVLVWWPPAATREPSAPGIYNVADGIIPCKPWDLRLDPFQLPPIPDDLPRREDSHIELVKIAAMESSLIGLTNHGHVLKFDDLWTRKTAESKRWQYLPLFCETSEIQEQLIQQKIEVPQDVKITHITAQYQTFVAYSTGSSSVVLMGRDYTTPTSAPKVHSSLQNNDVISVVIGDYHFGALTSTGKLFTWGSFSKGALGLGDPTKLPVGQPGGYRNDAQKRRSANAHFMRDPPAVSNPSEVRFDHGFAEKRDTFCFAIAAAGWHTGALVIDMDVSHIAV
ncbi:RCC1 BLIP-II [Coniophora puteana RWD-64-598 SS2]|uniref:RCC1 BLIP-II n=1 Tax=Coniophora puteana (strain RWD-64-598) TaxID=741705 RepID=A0A5M3N2K2_CONPW|nr:RCC1 BLIP-II [Coniophora puteana RWD-64-598 SS2]EIW85613.1 RCC1 BLIP-II [Coniophora puteana RWD-64-598 SS2]